MTFNKRNFSISSASFSAAGGVPQKWSYRTTDSEADILASGYFDDVETNFNVGDILQVAFFNANGDFIEYRDYTIDDIGLNFALSYQFKECVSSMDIADVSVAGNHYLPSVFIDPQVEAITVAPQSVPTSGSNTLTFKNDFYGIIGTAVISHTDFPGVNIPVNIDKTNSHITGEVPMLIESDGAATGACRVNIQTLFKAKKIATV